MADASCGLSESGNAACSLTPGGCQCSSTSAELPLVGKQGGEPANDARVARKTGWTQIRSGALFVVACLTSPCCTPLYVPIALALLAGSPAALWLSANVGWVYGGLTLVSAVSLVLALRWYFGANRGQSASPAQSEQSVKTEEPTL